MAITCNRDGQCELARRLARAAAHLLDSLQGDLKAVVNLTKSLLLASSPALLDMLHSLLTDMGWTFRKVKRIKNLGVDFALEGQATTVSAARLKAQTKRKGRYLHLKS